ncbi:MAG: hypothetical protein MJA83_18025, partial [Gammaproteobacteria bacterium]|nr:hypothetical protein [Gammaproteobacteria bacterium]
RDSDLNHSADFKVTCPAFEVTKVRLKFTPDKNLFCPKKATTRAVFHTTRPGKVKYRRERLGGEPSKWITATSKRVGTVYKAVIENEQMVGEIDQRRRVVAKRFRNKPGQTTHPWVRFKTECMDILDSAIYLDGKEKALCPFKNDARVRFNTDMKGTFSYRVDCTDGTSWTGKTTAHRTAPGTFIAVDRKSFKVKKSGKLICALKVIKNGKPHTVTARGKDYACQDVFDAAVYLDAPANGRCPVNARARVRFNAPKAVDIPYRLDCTGERSWSRTVRARRTGPGTFIAVETLPFKVRRSEKVSCALKSLLTGASKIVGLRARQINCRTSDPPLTVDPRPTTSSLSCIGGRIQGNSCACPRGHRRKRLAARKFRCEPPKVVCKGGNLVKVGNAQTLTCRCRRGDKRRR